MNFTFDPETWFNVHIFWQKALSGIKNKPDRAKGEKNGPYKDSTQH